MTPHLGRLSPGRFLDYLRERVPGPAMVITPAGSPVYSATSYAVGIGVLPDGYQGDQDAVVPRASDPVAAGGWTATAGLLAKQAEIVHAAGGWLVGQIHHPGAERSWDSFQPSVAPSALDGEWPVQRPHALTDAEIDDLIAGYVANAVLIIDAGLDGVEVHAAHGYLLNRFLSPAYNRRTGRFGGSTIARWAILRIMLERIRSAIGPDPILGVRLSAFELMDGGLTVDDVATGAASCAEHLSYVNLSLGNHDGLVSGRPTLAYTTPWLVERPSLLAAARAVRAATQRPVLVTGGVTSMAAVEDLLAGGADLVGVARAAIADAGFARKVLAGRGDEINQCIGCNECTLVPFSCPVNPAAGREAELRARAAARPSTVVVVGGGPAGLSAGLAARARGHRVVVFEHSDVLGGRLAQLVQDPARASWSSWLRRLSAQANTELDVRLGHAPTVAELSELAPDVVVVAVGAVPAPTDFADDGSLPVVSSIDVLAGYRPTTDRAVLVVGGTEPHLDPLLTARLLAAEGHRVRLVSELVTVAPTVEQRTLNHLLSRLATTGVTIETSTRVSAIDSGEVTVERLLSGSEIRLDVGAVVLAHSRRPSTDVAALLDGWPGPIHVIGDALAPRRLTHAVLEGTRFGSSL